MPHKRLIMLLWFSSVMWSGCLFSCLFIFNQGRGFFNTEKLWMRTWRAVVGLITMYGFCYSSSADQNRISRKNRILFLFDWQPDFSDSDVLGVAALYSDRTSAI